jgi:hypothetical protein
MARYIFIDQNSGYIWGDSADIDGKIVTGTPVEVAAALDASLEEDPALFTYWQTHKSDPERTYDVYRADFGRTCQNADWHEERTGRFNAAESDGNDDRGHHDRNRLATTFRARLPRWSRPQEARSKFDVRTRRKRSRLSHHR